MTSIETRRNRTAVVRQQLAAEGLKELGAIHLDHPASELYEHIVLRREGRIAYGGALVVETGEYTGRSANDKFIVDEPSSRDQVAWGKVNRPFDEEKYFLLRGRVASFLQGRELFVQECRVGADPKHQRRVRVCTLWAWQSLFARSLFIHPRTFDPPIEQPDYTVICVPEFKADPERDGTRSEAFILAHLGRREILIGGTGYAGEIKKSIFSIMNHVLPDEQVLPMHCSANVGDRGDVAIFFGLSGTGKTSLSTDPQRRMIGDDEHGWSNNGVFNFEGGCYAKVINLSAKAEREIWECTQKFGTILENVVIDDVSRRVNLADSSRTENTRAGYPLTSLDNIQPDGQGSHPTHVIMLTADAFGVLPPVARLTGDQAMYHFLSGYTAKLAGTERGLTDPQATFSACFGEPFMVRDPVVYAEMLVEKLQKTGARCWLVNTGWTGGPYGEGFRMPIRETRNIIDHILNDSLNDAPTRREPYFGLEVPVSIPGVPDERLDPRRTWKDTQAYDEKASYLDERFAENFKKFNDRVADGVRNCCPGHNLPED